MESELLCDTDRYLNLEESLMLDQEEPKIDPMSSPPPKCDTESFEDIMERFLRSTSDQRCRGRKTAKKLIQRLEEKPGSTREMMKARKRIKLHLICSYTVIKELEIIDEKLKKCLEGSSVYLPPDV